MLICYEELSKVLDVECVAINRYAKGSNKYMKDYDASAELSYLMYWDVNNLYGWITSQTLPVGSF